MTQLHFLQLITLSFYALVSLFIFFRSWLRRRAVTLGTLETSLIPLIGLSTLLIVLDVPSSSSFQMGLGLALYMLGLILGAVAFQHLGWVNSDDFWIGHFERKQRTLVTSGPYKHIRHPVFLSLAVSYLGLVLVFFHPVTLVLWLLVVLFGVVTSLQEEHFMRSRFPQYQQYIQTSKRFVPGLF